VGTRYEDQPVEQWAGPESLDPTPVWKQYLLVAAFVVVALVLVAVVAYSALAVELATPPASVIGGRVVLAASDVPSVNRPAKLYGAPLVDAQHAFYLIQYKPGAFLAIRAAGFPNIADGHTIVAVDESPGGPPPTFDRYLVSVEGAKVVVNTSRVINGTEVVPAPSDPTFR
jgi:membrane-associated protease RseP (regulator of RpoE activity)